LFEFVNLTKEKCMAEDYKERARQRKKARQQSVWFKLVEGENTFRILPTQEGADVETSPSRFIEYAVHRDVGPKKIQVRCGKDLNGEGECWLCDIKIEKLKDSGNDARAAALMPKDVFLVQVARVDEDGNFTGPFLMTPSKTLADGILGLLGARNKDYADPKKGRNITVERTGTGRNDTRYGALMVDEDPTAVPVEILKKLKPFDELKEIPRYSEGAQKAAYQGIDYVEPDEGDEDEDEAPRKKKPAGKVAGKKPKPAPDEDEDDVTDDEDAEEEEAEADEDAVDEDAEDVGDDDDDVPPAKPGKKKPVAAPPSKKKPKPEPEPDEDEEEAEEDADADSEDDEEEEAPPKKPGKKPVAAAPAKKKPVSKPDDDIEDLDDLDDLEDLDDDEDAEEEEEAPPKKKPAAAPPVKKKPAAGPPPRPKRK
jgi:hypothetical protein